MKQIYWIKDKRKYHLIRKGTYTKPHSLKPNGIEKWGDFGLFLTKCIHQGLIKDDERLIGLSYLICRPGETIYPSDIKTLKEARKQLREWIVRKAYYPHGFEITKKRKEQKG